MNELHISTEQVLNGGIIETWKINSLFYVKSIINGVVKFSECVSDWDCKQFVFEAKFYGNLDF